MMFSVQQPSKQSGFTLVEMLIVIAVFALMTGGAVVTYRNFAQRQQVLQSAKNIQESMRFAQKKARAGEKPSGCTTLNGYILAGTTSSTTLTLTADCTNQDYQVTTGSLVGAARLASNISTSFHVITGGVTGTNTVRVTLGSYTYRFDVNVGGDISEGSYE